MAKKTKSKDTQKRKHKRSKKIKLEQLCNHCIFHRGSWRQGSGCKMGNRQTEPARDHGEWHLRTAGLDWTRRYNGDHPVCPDRIEHQQAARFPRALFTWKSKKAKRRWRREMWPAEYIRTRWWHQYHGLEPPKPRNA